MDINNIHIGYKIELDKHGKDIIFKQYNTKHLNYSYEDIVSITCLSKNDTELVRLEFILSTGVSFELTYHKDYISNAYPLYDSKILLEDLDKLIEIWNSE